MNEIAAQQGVKKVIGWSDEELAAAVHAYLEMLQHELMEIPYSLNNVIFTLQRDSLPGRSLRSVELRMQNISSVLYDLNFPLLAGCVPAHNVGSGIKGRIIELLYSKGLSWFEAYKKTAERELFERNASSLRIRAKIPVPRGTLVPKSESKSVTSFIRDPAVKAWVLKASAGICEGCKTPASFLGRDGQPYLEVHHVLPLAKYGSDRVTNAVALCPNCHMRCHYSIDLDEFKLHLYETIGRLVIEVPTAVADPTEEFLRFDVQIDS